MTYTYSSIIPLIGGLTLGAEKILGVPPKYIASWGSVFGNNDKYCLEYYGEPIPYIELENNTSYTSLEYVDIVTSLPPCAGLSMGNSSKNRGCNAMSNIHMLKASELAMKYITPRAIIVENAPNLFTKAGEPFAEKICDLASTHNYSMSIIKTSTILHGLPQERTRSFFILWRGNKAPILNKVHKQYSPFHEFMSESFKQSPSVTKNTKKPSEDLLWRFIQSKNPKLSDQEIICKYANKKMVSVWEIIYNNGWLPEAASLYKDVPKLGKHLSYTLDKKQRGLNIMDASQKIAWERTQALMWKSLPYLRHPLEDRWLMTSEALALMGFPNSFVNIPTQDSNAICQNCPVSTAADWINEIVEALNGNRVWIDIPAGQILRQSNVSKSDVMKPCLK